MTLNDALTQLGLMTVTLLPIVVSPGASFTLTLQCAVRGDRQGPVRILLGTGLGIFTLALILGGTGLSPFILGHPALLRVISVVGGGLLIGLGFQTLYNLNTVPFSSARDAAAIPRSGSLLSLSYFTLIGNPKAILVYLLVAPKTMTRVNPQGYLAFSSAHVAVLALWLLTLSLLGQQYQQWFRDRRLAGALLGLTGLYLILLGVLTVIG